MRILSVAGENLASLRDPFRLDFDKPPLADAGLFVITGRTGSGKSTLLDAICLALYNRIPRLRSKKDLSNKVEDLPGGDLLSDNDPRQILRRGAGAAYAEVRFQGLDGKIYRSTWHVHRANKRPTGKLQESELTLVNETENHIELQGRSYKEEYTERITRLVGMNYEQFVRAVVLAQSQFDAFLKAPADEKASLLEQLTDTREFASISRTIFSRYTALKEEVERKKHEISALGCLSPEEVVTLQKEQLAQNELVGRSKQTVEQLTQSVKWYELAAQIHQEVLLAQKDVTQTEAERATLEQERSWVTQWEESREVRQELTQLSEGKKQLNEVINNLRNKSTTLQRAAKQTRNLEAEQEALLLQQEALAVERVQLAHTQEACKGVNTEICAQEELIKGLETKRQALLKQGKEANEEEKKQATALQQLKEQIIQRDTLRTRLAPRQALYEGLESISQNLSSLTATIQQIDLENKGLAASTETRERLLQQQKELEAQWTTLVGSTPVEILPLRALLREGEPCPLCGSTTHPLGTATPPEHAQHWETLRTQQEALKAQREALEKALHDNELTSEKQRSTLEVLEKQRAQYVAQLAVLSPTPPTPTPEWLAQLRERLTVLQTERTQWQAVERAAGLDAQIETNERLLQNHAETIQRLRKEYKEVLSQQNEAQSKILVLKTQLSDLTDGNPLEHLERAFQVRFRAHDLRSTELKRQLAAATEQQQLLSQTTYHLNHNRHELRLRLHEAQTRITAWLAAHPAYTPSQLESLQTHTEAEVRHFRERWETSQQATTKAQTILKERTAREAAHIAECPNDIRPLEEITQTLASERKTLEEAQERYAYYTVQLEEQAKKRTTQQALEKELAALDTQCRAWAQLNELLGSRDGKRFRVIAQSYTLTALLEFANRQLTRIMPRYRLERAASETSTLSLRIVDTQMGGEVRNIDTLSGGETFIVSLALSLALSSISSHHHAIELLFIDEGFGTLDADNLRLVLETLEGLQMQGRRIGLISHVAELNERIAVQVQVEKQGGDASRVKVVGR